MSNQVTFHVKLENPVRYPWRERNVVYLVLLSYSLWARRIAKEYAYAITRKNHEGDKVCG